MKRQWAKKIRMYFSFAVTIAVTLVLLKLANWIPSTIQHNDMRKYGSLREVTANLHIRRIYVPSYFPEYIKWPPVEVFARKRPSELVVMHFIHERENNIALSIHQAAAGDNYDAGFGSELLYIKKEDKIDFRGRKASLILAVCSGHIRCNKLSWNEGGYHLSLIADDEPDQIIKMAESML